MADLLYIGHFPPNFFHVLESTYKTDSDVQMVSNDSASFVAFISVQFSSEARSCPTLCDPMDCSTPGFPVHHQLPELAQMHVH